MCLWEYGLQALTAHWITGRQIEAGRVGRPISPPRRQSVISGSFRITRTVQALETRMGKGKAEVAGWWPA